PSWVLPPGAARSGLRGGDRLRAIGEPGGRTGTAGARERPATDANPGRGAGDSGAGAQLSKR
ncbi:hypothetical protein, partial [Kocuria salsicia]|uniref:hypothetical protein n=1 Tax=Kocuria salsicia TaxID=664639 RepID=UPI001E3B6517